MRDIKFRGKDSKGKWHYGYLISGNNVDYNIYVPDEKDYYRVLEDTIGQYTGMKDRNGKDVYEGDVLNIEFHYKVDGREVCLEPCLGVATYDTERYAFCIKKTGLVNSLLLAYYEDKDFVVVGNIYDNPGLIKKE